MTWLAARLRTLMQDCVHQFSRLVPKQKGLWVFVGWHRGESGEIFADNAKYLFLHTSNNYPASNCVWLAKDTSLAATLCSHGYRSHYEHSVAGVWTAIRAEATIIDAYLQPSNYYWSGGTRLVQLLHGKGMKGGGYAHPPMQKQDDICVPSPFVAEMLPPQFVELSRIHTTGYPRSDVLFHDVAGSSIGTDPSLMASLAASKHAKKILYAPTFRRNVKEFPLDTVFDLNTLAAWLAERDFLLVISLHPKYRNQVRSHSFSSILFVSDSDIYPALHHFDALVTDYSSLFTDFLLLDRPVIFFPYDLNSYQQNEGFSVESYADYTPGPKAFTQNELQATIIQSLTFDEYAEARKRALSLYHSHQDGNSCERVLAALCTHCSSSPLK